MLTKEQEREYKIAYNKLITRHNKAAAYLDNNDVPIEEREKHIPDFQKLLANINKAIETFKSHGIEMSDKQILEGFRDASIKS